MKKNYFLFIVTMLLGLGSFAQLTGTYTINGAATTGGTNYQTFQAAVSALNTSGVSGPTTFNVAAGNYTGEVLIGAITGASATNTITFDGGSAGATLTNNSSTSTTGTVRFLNASYTSFMNLNINTVTGYGRVVFFDGNNNNITIKKCNITTRVGTSSSYTSIYNESGTGSMSNFITIDSNVISNGYYGIYWYGGSSSEANHEDGNKFTNNTVLDYYYYGTMIYYQKNMDISNNVIRNNTAISGTCYGLRVYYGFYNKIENNDIQIKGTSTQYGLYCYYQYATTANTASVANNMIVAENTGTGSVYGLYAYYSRNIKFYHNSVNVMGGGTNTFGVYSYCSNSTNYENMEFVNNIFVNSGTGRAAYYYNRYSKISVISNNIYNSSNTLPIYYYGTAGSYQTFASYQTNAAPLGATDLFGDPQFIGPNDLHLQGTIANDAGNNTAGISTDFDGEARPMAPSTTVDIGADEYTPPTCPASSALASFNPTGSTHDVSWTAAAAATSWLVEYGAPGFTPGTGTSVPSTNDTLTITGLTAQTDYEFYVRGICGPGDTSIYAGPGTFRTACAFTLSGAYTVDPASAASTTNFVSLQSLFQTLEDCGMTGPTTVTVAAGSGPHIMNWDLDGINGLNGTNTLTIDGNGTTVNRGTGNYFLALNGITHTTIENFMFVNETPTSGMWGILLRGGCDSVTIKNNTINVGIGHTLFQSCGIASSNSLTSHSTYGDNADNLTIDSNTIIGGYYGIRLNGTSTSVKATGCRITNNTIEDAYVYSMYNYYHDDLIIHNNDISRPNRTTLTTFYGVYAYYSTKTIISNNKIHDAGVGSYTAYPIYFGQSSNSLGNESYVVNNAVYDIGPNGTGTFYGLYLNSTMSYINVWHNTVQKSTDGSTGTHRGIYRSSTPNNENYTNNLVSITGSGTGTKYCYYSNSSSTFTGGNNLFHMGATAGTNNTAYFSGNQATIAAWSTATSTTGNSDVNPSIVAGTYTPLAGPADDLGTPLPLVPTDIDGMPRSATTPDFGAVEFVGLPGDMSIQDVWLEEVDACYGVADSAYVTIQNDFGTSVNFATNNLTVNWTTTGPVADAGSLTIASGTLAVGATMDFYIASIDMSSPGIYTVSANISANAVNASALNDTLTDHSTFDKKAMIAVNPKSDTSVFIAGSMDSVKISTQSPFFPGGAFLITEICQYAGATNGRPVGGKPSWMGTCDDYVEITGVPNSDLAGFTLEKYNASGLYNASTTYTFPSGTILSPNGTCIISTYNGTSSPANFFYTSFSVSSGSSSTSGTVLKDPSGNVVDAVGYYNYNAFPAVSGVTASDWSAGFSHSSGTWGIRLTGADVNSATNWVLSTTPKQDPNTVNAGVTVPAPSSVAGLQWTDITNSMALDTTPEIYAKGWTTNGLYQYEATFVTPCGTYSDTSDLLILLQSYDTVGDTTVCDIFSTPLGGNIATTSGYPTDTIFGTNPVYDSIIIFYPLTVNVMTTETLNIAICDSLVSPSGKSLKATGTYMDTIPNAIGCDSIITINLTITTTTFIDSTIFACDSVMWRGTNYTTAGVYKDTVLTASCDSIYTLNLSMGYTSRVTFTEFVCDSMVSPTGKVWNMDGTYLDTIMNASGCDSIMTYDLTFGYISYETITWTGVICDSMVSPSGKVWTASGTYLDTIVNASGCDSAMTFNINIKYSVSRTDNIALCPGKTHRVGPSLYTTAGTYTNVFSTFHGCDSTIITNLSYYAPAVATVNYNFCTGDSVMILGNWYYAATTFMDTIVGGSSHGCDSVTTHKLTTRTVSPALNLGADVVSCVDGGVTVYASTAYDTYNWSTGGTTNMLSVNGVIIGTGTNNYVLTVTQASTGCTATDDINITFNSCVGLEEVDADLNVNLYPNPATNFVTIEIFDKFNEGNLRLEILNSIGQVVSSRNIANSSEKVIMDVNNFSKGMYLVRISSDKLYMTKKLIIQN